MIKHLKIGLSVGLVVNFIARDSITSLIAASLIILADAGFAAFNMYMSTKDNTITARLDDMQSKINDITLRIMGR
jgi:hypothetical protein